MINKEQIRSQEWERPNIGVGLIIINPREQIWTNVELIAKKDTARNAKDISITTEQAKKGEGFWENVKGGLGEFCSDKDMQTLRKNLFVVGLPRVIGVESNNWRVACSLVIVMCNIDINPTPATNEVAPNKWMNMEEILGLSNLRPFSRQLLEVAKRDNLIERALNQKSEKFPILEEFGNGVSFNKFIQKRDLLPDRDRNIDSKIRLKQEILNLFPKKILIGEPHGLCAGVTRSINGYQKAIDMLLTESPQAKIHSLGEPAHNTFINDEFMQQGVIFIDSPEEAPQGATILLGAHGTSPIVRKTAENLGQKLIDTVCPLVEKTHAEAAKFQREGYTVIYFGKKGHQEAENLLGESLEEGNIILIEKLGDLKEIDNKIKDPKKVAFLSQTTHPAFKAEEVKQALLKQFPDLRYPSHTDTCYATENRQRAVKEMVEKGAQTIVVVGSKTSSNSHELQKVAIEAGANGIFVDSADELRTDQFAGIDIIGLTSGASVLDKTFLEVANWFIGKGVTNFISVEAANENKIKFPPVKM